MKEISLSRGLVAIVDDSDYTSVSKFNWHASDKGYALRSIRVGDKIVKQTLHHFLVPGHPRIDHEDGNRLNNRRENLRPASHTENLRGFQKKRKSSSKFRGVYWHSKEKKWRASIGVAGVTKYLGRFDSQTDAARAYDAAAKTIFGTFATPNF